MSFNQGEFDFNSSGSDAGWRQWRAHLDQKKREFESRWGVALGKNVIVTLRNHAKPIRGVIEWIQPPSRQPQQPPKFRIRGIVFGHDEIEGLVQSPGD